MVVRSFTTLIGRGAAGHPINHFWEKKGENSVGEHLAKVSPIPKDTAITSMA